MKKFPADQQKTYRGCDPEIAEALRNNEAVLGQVRGNDASQWRDARITHYSEIKAAYLASVVLSDAEAEVWWKEARLKKVAFRVMPAERAIPILMANGAEYNKHGNLIIPGEPELFINHLMHFHFGRRFDDYTEDKYGRTVSDYTWPECIIEEVQ